VRGLVSGFEGFTSKQRARGRCRVRVTARMARRESRFTKWQARPHAQGRRSRSSNKEPTKEWPITLDSPKQHDKALAWRRLFSQPLACPLSTPGLNLLGLEAQPHQPIQQHVSTVDSTPCATPATAANRPTEVKHYARPGRYCCHALSTASLPCPFRGDRHAPAVLVSAETSAIRCSSPCFCPRSRRTRQQTTSS
jgi:hypothetical protein